MTALRTLTGFDTECFGSPLNVHEGTTRFFTEFPADRIFGACHDAFTNRWSGSVELNPEYTTEALLQAVRQAVACAKMAGSAPFLAVAVLPVWDRQPFTRILKNYSDCCHTLAQVPKGYFHFDRPEYAPQQSGAGGRNAAGHAKWPVQIVLIYNANGLAQFLQRGAFDDFCHAVTAHALRTRYPSRRPAVYGTPAYNATRSEIAFSLPPDPSQIAPPPRAPRPWMRAIWRGPTAP